ncbi:hypothetical protein [Kibdelosporangium philippinense]|uniref:hypothetical protein n=1 Tax=Kibdelosporangium philippinense TaxID=211113 RepID=UPI003618F3FD
MRAHQIVKDGHETVHRQPRWGTHQRGLLVAAERTVEFSQPVHDRDQWHLADPVGHNRRGNQMDPRYQ